MRVDLFNFDLPVHRIADRPVKPRDSARMLFVSGSRLLDEKVQNLPEILREGDVLVFNNTQVIPARLCGYRDDVKTELLLHLQESSDTWQAFVRPAKRLKLGQTISFGEDLTACVGERLAGGLIRLTFSCAGQELRVALDTHGQMPLPPYMRRAADERDDVDYQTVYARERGAIAAPTAGLHFTRTLLNLLDVAKIERQFVTLHVGAGTFLPVTVNDTNDHKMYFEYGQIDELVATALNEARQEKRRIIAVGTTTLRLLESAADEYGEFAPFSTKTNLFITPGYKFKAVDALLTNFHLPRSTLFMLVCAFSGINCMQRAYAYAIEAGYRFYSYGDSCFLERDVAL